MVDWHWEAPYPYLPVLKLTVPATTPPEMMIIKLIQLRKLNNNLIHVLESHWMRKRIRNFISYFSLFLNIIHDFIYIINITVRNKVSIVVVMINTSYVTVAFATYRKFWAFFITWEYWAYCKADSDLSLCTGSSLSSFFPFTAPVVVY